jgi:phosphoglycolate phosphatase-like HAD superfamily hydrolase
MKYRHIIFDFDGVLVESNEIRFNGFRKLFKDYPQGEVKKLVGYAKANGGVSRYKKIEYFFNEIRREPISEESVNQWAAQFSTLVEQDIVEAKSVEGSLEFLEDYSGNFDFAIVSGSDQAELRRICEKRKINHFFKMILGSPVEKKDNIASLLSDLNWQHNESLYVGDSNNDLDAAKANDLDFVGRCSGLINWEKSNVRFILDLSSLYKVLH